MLNEGNREFEITPVTPIVAKPTLAEKVRAIHALRSDAAVGPLRAAELLIPILDDWPSWQEEAGGLSGEEWCTVTFGSQGYYASARRRFEAVSKVRAMGYSRDCALSRFHHLALVYMVGASVPIPKRKVVVSHILALTKERGVHVLEYGVVISAVRKLLGKTTEAIVEDDSYDRLLAYTLIVCKLATDAGVEIPPFPEGLDETNELLVI